MPEVIEVYKGSTADTLTCKVRRRNPQTNAWEDDDLSDVTAIVATMIDATTGTPKFTDQTASVDVTNSFVEYEPAAADVDTVGYYELRWIATRGGKPQILPRVEDNKVYVRVWE
jgi:hypothetical protein